MPKQPPLNPPDSDHDAPTAPSSRAGSQPINSSFILGTDRRAPLPQSIDRYKVIRELGRGGMGVVYLAKRADDAITAPVALKILKRGLDTDHILRRFNLERQLLGALNHPNIARLLDAGSTADGLPYIVMEFIEGEPVHRHCDNAQLDIPARLRLFQKICAGVHALHQNLVVHRDLKPTNILVTSQGEPKLLDLGIAKLVNPVMGGLAEQTIGEHQLMTPEYASPEQVAGRAITTASDIYSLGMILYELLTGERAYQFANRTTEEIRRVVCDVDPEKPSTRVARIIRTATVGPTPTGRGPDAPPESAIHRPATAITKAVPPQRLARALEGDLDDIIMMALEKVPSRRYPSAQDLAADIERYLADEPVTARRTSRRGLYRAAKFVHRNRRGVAVAAGAAVALAASTAVAVTGWVNRDAAAKESQRAAQTMAEAKSIAEQQRDEADKQRRAKEVALAQGLAAVESSLTMTYENVRRLESPTDALRSIVDVARTYIGEVARQNPDDASVMAVMGETYEKLGSLQYGPDAPHLGRPSEALASFSDSIEIRKRLAALNPADTGLLGQLWQTCRFAGQTALVLGKPEEAERSQRESLGYADSDPSRAPERRAVTLASLADALRDLGRWQDAESAIRESLRLRQALAAEKPDSDTSRSRIATGLQSLGEFLLEQGRPADAVEPLQQNFELRSTLAKARPEDKGAPFRSLANARLLLGQSLVWSGNTKEGLALMRQAEADLDAPSKPNESEGAPPPPSAESVTRDARKLGNLAEIAGRLSAAYLQAGMHAEAENAASRQVNRASELLKLDAANIRARLMLVEGLRVRSLSLTAQNKAAEARGAAETALAEARRAEQNAPSSGRAKRAVARATEARLAAGGLQRAEVESIVNDAMRGLMQIGQSLPIDKELIQRLLASKGDAK